MGLQDALEVQEMQSKIVPATRTFVLRRTSRTMRAAVEKTKLDVLVVSVVKFRNGEGLLDKLNGLNAWCRVTELRLNECKLGEGGAQAIAAALRVNTTLTELDLRINVLGEGGGQAIAAALRVNTTLTELNLNSNRLGEGGTQAIADVLRENSTFQTLNLHGNSLEGGVKSAVRQSWGNRGGKLVL